MFLWEMKAGEKIALENVQYHIEQFALMCENIAEHFIMAGNTFAFCKLIAVWIDIGKGKC